MFWQNDLGKVLVGNVDGSQMRGFPNNAEHFGAGLSPDGTQIAYWESGFIFVHNLQSGETQQINQDFIGSRQSGSLAWSPEGDRIAFDCLIAGFEHSDLCLMNLVTGTHQVLTLPADEANTGISLGSWNSDGDWIVYVREEFPDEGFAKGHLQQINVNSSEVQNLYGERGSPEISFLTHPAFSPDGNTILFQANVNGVPEIFSIDPLSKEVQQITTANNNFGTTWPVWSPSGKSFFASIVFVSASGDLELQPTLFSLSGQKIWQITEMNGWIMGSALASP